MVDFDFAEWLFLAFFWLFLAVFGGCLWLLVAVCGCFWRFAGWAWFGRVMSVWSGHVAEQIDRSID